MEILVKKNSKTKKEILLEMEELRRKLDAAERQIQDLTNPKQSEEREKISGRRYQRLFEKAQDGLLTLDDEKEEISEDNPCLIDMSGDSNEDFLRKKLWEIGPFKNKEASKSAFMELQSKGHVRFEDLPFGKNDGRPMAVDEQTAERWTAQEQLGQEIEKHCRSEEFRNENIFDIKPLKEKGETGNIYFSKKIKMNHRFQPIIGDSDGIKYILYRAEQVAPHNTTVLVLGETGTGKELIAAAIHNLSPRQNRPLIIVNCATLPANLMESELFGREKGAFTGADTRQVGRFEIAHGSTLCLDEIGELPLDLQAKLLRVIQHNEFERLGSSQTIKVDVRILATTNRNLAEEVQKGRFRQDLYYRLNVFPITVPPLRQRKDDIPVLVQAFTERYAKKLGKQITSIRKKTMRDLQDYPWPGNIRELESIIERAVILCPGSVLQVSDKREIASLPFSTAMNTLEEVERNQILKGLSETRWRIEGNDGAATILGLHPSTLRARMKKLGIARQET
jgi:formate hydrogenlyase transcriptional activator